ncbi:MAG: helicase-related protein [Ktedonobacterales bacterium]
MGTCLLRPDYLRFDAIAETLGRPTLLALTATAAPPVREEIIERLGMRNARTLVQGFDRLNIWLGVETFHDEASKTQVLLDRVIEAEKPGIVYVATRNGAEAPAQALTERGIRAEAYHAGMRAEDRACAQEAFMSDRSTVIVATSAIGMGVDKPNVRFVFHHSISDSVDACYQAIRRAILFYRPEDLNLRRFFAEAGQVEGGDRARGAGARS